MVLPAADMMIGTRVVEESVNDSLAGRRAWQRSLERALEIQPSRKIEAACNRELEIPKRGGRRPIRQRATEPANGFLFAALKRLPTTLRIFPKTLERLSGRGLPFHRTSSRDAC